MIEALEPKKVAENELACFYVSMMTKELSKDAKPLGMSVIIGESKKTGAKQYLLTRRGDVMHATETADAMACKINVLKMA